VSDCNEGVAFAKFPVVKIEQLMSLFIVKEIALLHSSFAGGGGGVVIHKSNVVL
jgi:hypothetical protein